MGECEMTARGGSVVIPNEDWFSLIEVDYNKKKLPRNL